MVEIFYLQSSPHIDSCSPQTPDLHQLSSPRKQKQQTITLILKKLVKSERSEFAEGRTADLRRLNGLRIFCLKLIFVGFSYKNLGAMGRRFC